MVLDPIDAVDVVQNSVEQASITDVVVRVAQTEGMRDKRSPYVKAAIFILTRIWGIFEEDWGRGYLEECLQF